MKKYEMLVGLNILNDEVYSQYREAMTPILKTYGGGFSYDFKTSETLKSATTEKINRVFTIYFNDKESMDSFFSNEDYLKAKEQFFEASVGDTTIISSYEVER